MKGGTYLENLFTVETTRTVFVMISMGEFMDEDTTSAPQTTQEEAAVSQRRSLPRGALTVCR